MMDSPNAVLLLARSLGSSNKKVVILLARCVCDGPADGPGRA